MSKNSEILLTNSAIDFLKEETGSTTVVANPTLVGDEPDLTGLEVGDTKYKVPSGGIEFVDIDVSQGSYDSQTNKWSGTITTEQKTKLLNGANIKTYNLEGYIQSAVCYLDRFSSTQNVYKSLKNIVLLDDDTPYFYNVEHQIVEIDLENNTYTAYYEQFSLPTLA